MDKPYSISRGIRALLDRQAPGGPEGEAHFECERVIQRFDSSNPLKSDLAAGGLSRSFAVAT
jgi:hypothetical protein